MDELHFTRDNADAVLLARVPCVVQLPFQEVLDQYFSQSAYSVALAQFGRNWLRDLTVSCHPQVIVGTGIEGMIPEHPEEKGFAARSAGRLDNPDFDGFADPEGVYDIAACIPMTMVVDMGRAEGRPLPETLSDLLRDEYRGSIVYPDDGALLDSILFTYIYKAAGYEGVAAFRRNCLAGLHPSQMIHPGGMSVKPFIMVMPWIFARLKAMQPGMSLRWFSDGAPIIPVAVTAQDTRDAARFLDVLCQEQTGRVFREQGFFPSACRTIDNRLPGKLAFIGWDFLRRPDLPDIIAGCRKIMEGEV